MAEKTYTVVVTTQVNIEETLAPGLKAIYQVKPELIMELIAKIVRDDPANTTIQWS